MRTLNSSSISIRRAKSLSTRSFTAARCLSLFATFLLLLSATELIASEDSAPPATTSTNSELKSTVPTIEALQVGFNGDFKLGYWTPVTIELRGATKPSSTVITVEVRDGDGLLTRFTTDPAKPIDLPPGESHSVTLQVKFGRPTGEIIVRASSDDQQFSKRSFSYGDSPHDNARRALPADAELLLLVGPKIGLAKAVEDDRHSQIEGRPTHVARLEDSSTLPTDWIAYQGVDTLALAPSQPAVLQSLLQNRQQGAALRQWVEQGGQLVLFVGAQAETILANDSPLRQLAPGPFDGFGELRDTRELEIYCESNAPVRMDLLKQPLQVPRLSNPNSAKPKSAQPVGIVEVSLVGEVGRIPVVVRRPVGFGEVLYVALDMDQPPMSNWLSRSRFFRRLLGRKTDYGKETVKHSAQRLRTLGYHDLVGQLHAALDDFPSVRVVPFGLVVLLILIYIALIGPGDYFFLKRVIGRLEWTWLTFTCLVVGAGAITFWLAHHWKSNTPQINQVELIDLDLESQQLRGSVWLNLYNPSSKSADLAFDPSALGQSRLPTAQVRLAWLGVPGRGLGGMQSQANQPGPTTPYQFAASLETLNQVPLASWSAKAFAVGWNSKTESGMTVNLHNATDNMVEGTLQNNTGVNLVDCRLFYKRWSYSLPDIPTGAEQAIDRKLNPRSLRGALTAKAYSPTTTQVAPILDMIMFQRTAGGQKFTRLNHHYQSRLDMNDQLALGRAILIAQVEDATSTSDFLLDGEPLPDSQIRRQTFYRFVLPVQEKQSP